jgi:hypothetical protein
VNRYYETAASLRARESPGKKDVLPKVALKKKTSRHESFPRKDITPGIVAEK